MSVQKLFGSFKELWRNPNSAVCIPLAPRVPATERVSDLLDMPFVQRLRAIRQLALAHIVYPDATHTRFGHSLGVFARCGKSLLAILSREENEVFRREIDEKEIAALLVASLIHDAGHYPMAHSFEELIPRGIVAGDLKHDAVLIRMLTGDIPAVLNEVHLEELQTVLKKWHGITIGDVLAVFTGFPHYAETINKRADVIKVLHSFLDGPFDADKLDYVQRDSLHTGNPAGSAVDEERLIDSILIKSLERGVGVDENGLYAAQSLHTARAAMFASVYWHRANRAANRMFTHALEMVMAAAPKRISDAFEDEVFRLDDEAMLRFVATHLAAVDDTAVDALLHPLMAVSGGRRRLFRRLVTIAARPGSISIGTSSRDDPHALICKIYDAYLAPEPLRNKTPWIDFERAAREKVLAMAGGGAPFEVLLDVPDSRFETSVHDDPNTELGRSGFWVYGADQEPVPIKQKDPLFGAVLENWRINARKIRVFTSPRIEEKLKGRESEISGFLAELAKAPFEPGGPLH